MAGKELVFEELRVGDELEPLVRPVTREQMKEYVEAAGDPNPIHVDDEAARSFGFQGVIVPGMLEMGFLAQLIVEKCGAGNLKKLKVRFSKVAYPGTLTCKGVITKKYIEEGKKYVESDVYVEDELGEKKVMGSALFTLP